MTLTLRARLAVTTVVLFGLLTAGLTFVTFRVLARQLDNDQTARLTELANGVEGYLHIQDNAVSVESDQLDDDEAAFVHDATQYYQVYDERTGSLLAESPAMTPLGLDLTPSEVQATHSVGHPIDVTTPYGRLRIVIHDIVNGGRIYHLHVGASLATMDAALARYRALLLLRVPPVFLLVAALAWWLSGFALAPLARVAAAADAIDVATLAQRLPTRGVNDELEHVTSAFNATLARLEHSVGEMRQFSAALAHELRTPLAALRGQVELSLMAADSTEQQKISFESQLDDIDRLARLIDQILTLARAESGQIRLTIAPVDLNALARSVAEQLELVAESHSITLTCADGTSAVVDGDAAWLQRLLLNLLGNALKYTKPGGYVTVRVSTGHGSARLQVQDTGIGLSPKDATQVFERFFRADPSRTTAIEGSGLGLSLVQWIATQHHGSVSVESTLGVGSTFTVTLPLHRG